MSFKDFLDPATPLEKYNPEHAGKELEELLTLLLDDDDMTHRVRIRTLCLANVCAIHSGEVALKKALQQILWTEQKAIEAELARRKEDSNGH